MRGRGGKGGREGCVWEMKKLLHIIASTKENHNFFYFLFCHCGDSDLNIAQILFHCFPRSQKFLAVECFYVPEVALLPLH